MELSGHSLVSDYGGCPLAEVRLYDGDRSKAK